MASRTKGIRRLAEHLDISIGTVSRALNGRPDVKEATRRRVLAAAAELGYVPNQSGRALRQGTTNVIGFMMQTGHEITGEGDTFFMSVFDGVQTVLARHRLDLVVMPCSSEEDPDAYVQRMVARGFADALILSATRRRDNRIDFLAERNIPFIALGRSLSDAGHPWFDLDFESMARVAIDRLVARGHRRIALFRPLTELNLGYVLLEHYRRALGAHGIGFDPAIVYRATPNEAGGYEIARRIAADPDRPTAIVILNQVMTVGLYRGLYEAGIHPGRDIAVIGEESPQSRFLTPSLTGFRFSLRDLGIALAEGLLAAMPAHAATYPSGTVRRIWPMELVEGASDDVSVPR